MLNSGAGCHAASRKKDFENFQTKNCHGGQIHGIARWRMHLLAQSQSFTLTIVFSGKMQMKTNRQPSWVRSGPHDEHSSSQWTSRDPETSMGARNCRALSRRIALNSWYANQFKIIPWLRESRKSLVHSGAMDSKCCSSSRQLESHSPI